jgi:hypothetical protein
MTGRAKAREQYSLYMVRAAMAERKAAQKTSKEAEYWIKMARLWLCMANDIREVWGGSDWSVR